MIPKIIHLCWLSGDPYPEKIRYCIDSWKRFLPDYEIMLWDTNRFDVNSTLWTKQAFEAKKYAFAADYIRFYAVYKFGGIYLDSDVEVIKPFDDLLHLPYFVGNEAIPSSIELAAFGAEKGMQWVKDAMDYYTDRPFVKQSGELDNMPLPFVMMPLLGEKYVIVRIENLSEYNPDPSMLCILPTEWFNANPSFNGRGQSHAITENTYCIHHFAESWIDDDYPGGPLHRLYYKITGKDWRLSDRFVRLYGTNKKNIKK